LIVAIQPYQTSETYMAAMDNTQSDTQKPQSYNQKLSMGWWDGMDRVVDRLAMQLTGKRLLATRSHGHRHTHTQSADMRIYTVGWLQVKHWASRRPQLV